MRPLLSHELKIAAIGIALAVGFTLLAGPVALLFLLGLGAAVLVLAAVGARLGLAIVLTLVLVGHCLALDNVRPWWRTPHQRAAMAGFPAIAAGRAGYASDCPFSRLLLSRPR